MRFQFVGKELSQVQKNRLILNLEVDHQINVSIGLGLNNPYISTAFTIISGFWTHSQNLNSSIFTKRPFYTEIIVSGDKQLMIFAFQNMNLTLNIRLSMYINRIVFFEEFWEESKIKRLWFVELNFGWIIWGQFRIVEIVLVVPIYVYFSILFGLYTYCIVSFVVFVPFSQYSVIQVQNQRIDFLLLDQRPLIKRRSTISPSSNNCLYHTSLIRTDMNFQVLTITIIIEVEIFPIIRLHWNSQYMSPQNLLIFHICL